MAMQNYDGPAGKFVYDTTQFMIEGDTGLLKYIGQERYGEQIHIPDGIRIIDGMFKGSNVVTPPLIPDSVLSMQEAFEGSTLIVFPDIPTSVVNMHHAFSGISTRDIQVSQDPTEQYIFAEIQQNTREIEELYQSEILDIQDIFFSTNKNTPEREQKAREKADKAIVNSQLKAEIAICRANLDGLEKMQRNIEYKLQSEKTMGAPTDYMIMSYNQKNYQIARIKQDIAHLEGELKLRNPTTMDLITSHTIKASEWLVSASQKSMNKIIDKVTEIRTTVKNYKGNIYRAAELAQAKYDLKIDELALKLQKEDLKRSASVYNKVIPWIADVSKKFNNMHESLKAFKAGAEDKEYITKLGLSENGKKLISSIYSNIERKMTDIIRSESEMNISKLKVDKLEPNLSPTERQHTINFIREAAEQVKEVQRQAKAAAEETIQYYNNVKEAKEQDNTEKYEQEMTAEDISRTYPENVHGAMDMSKSAPSSRKMTKEEQLGADMDKSSAEAAFIGGYLYNEISHEREGFSQEEFEAGLETILNNFKSGSEEKINDIVSSVEEKGVHVKEDHAEVLASSIGISTVFDNGAPDFEPTKPRNTIMNSALGKEVTETAAERNSSVEKAVVQNMDSIDIKK